MAPRSEEAEAWFAMVYSAVREIPQGMVTSYGHIARLIGHPERPRQVGVCLKHLPDDAALPHNNGNVPWQRVISAKGTISPRGPGGANRQAVVLRREGVEVQRGPLGELIIDLGKYGWFPDLLPSEEAESSDESDDPEAGDAEQGSED